MAEWQPRVLAALQHERDVTIAALVAACKSPAKGVEVPRLAKALCGEAPDPDLEGMVVYRSGPAPWVIPTLALVLGLIALVLALRFWWSKRSVIADEPEVVIDAGGEFMALVARLRTQLNDDPEVVRGCWFDLLTGLRVYLDRRFGLQSAQSTTEEMLSALASTRIVGIPRVGLSQLLERADEVRYAAAESSREAMADLLDQVEVWVGTAEQAKTQEDR